MAKVIGFLGATNAKVWSKYVTAFEEVLDQLGPIPVGGQKVAVSYKWANGDWTQYGPIAQQFVDDGVDAIVTSGTQCVNEAYKQIQNAKQIFFAAAGGPLSANNTAIGTLNDQAKSAFADQRFFKISQILPQPAGGGQPTVAVLGNYSLPNVKAEMDNIFGPNGNDGVAHNNQITVSKVDIAGKTPLEIDAAVAGLNVDLLYVCTDPMVTTHQDTIIARAKAKQLRTMFAFREYVENGGLISFGADFTGMFTTAAQNVHAYLRGVSLGQIRVAAPAALNPKFVLNTLTEAAIAKPIPQGLKNQCELWPPVP